MNKKVYTKPELQVIGKLINKTLGSSGTKNEPHSALDRPK